MNYAVGSEENNGRQLQPQHLLAMNRLRILEVIEALTKFSNDFLPGLRDGTRMDLGGCKVFFLYSVVDTRTGTVWKVGGRKKNSKMWDATGQSNDQETFILLFIYA